MIYSFTVTFGATYLTGMVTSVPPYETFSLKTTKITSKIQITEVCDLQVMLVMRPSFINMLFISTGIFDDKLRPQVLLVGTTANAAFNLYMSIG